MYFKLALRNVKKSYKDYMIYFLTLAFSVCLFYTFNSFQEQEAVISMTEAQFSLMAGVTDIMVALSVIVAFILGFLILYANNFLIRRRKKELGLYTLLGMPRRNISAILVYETLIIGIISLFTGLILGIFMSQMITVLTASLFEAELNYRFIFSMDATIFTILSFAIIFFIIMVFNTFILNRYKLIDLINADKQNENLKIKNVYISIILFLLSMVLLGGDYWFAWHYPLDAFGLFLMPVTLVGCTGTLLFFMSLSGFLLKFIQTSKTLYYRKLNMFVLRQINANINSNFVSMSVVCVMLLLSIGALSTGMNLNKTLNNSVRMSTPYDWSYSPTRNEHYEIIIPDFEEKVKALPIDRSQVEEEIFLHQYATQHNLADIFEELHINSSLLVSHELLEATPISAVKLSEYNKLLENFHEDPIQLADDEAYVFSNLNLINEDITKFLESQKSLELFGHTVTPINTEYDEYMMATTGFMGNEPMVFVLNDEQIPTDAKTVETYWNIDLKKGTDVDTFSDNVYRAIYEYNETVPPEEQIMGSMDTRQSIRENSKGMAVIFTYIGIYLGIVFLIASAVILALQQLSQASDNRKRYLVLDKIGASRTMMDHSILQQLGIYFFLPLFLAIVHSVVGIKVVNSIIVYMGKGDLFGASIITGGIILLIYGTYFLVTYFGYKNILHQK